MDVLGQRWRSRFSAAEYDPVAPRRCCQSGGGALLAQSSRKLKFQMRFLLIQVSALSLSLIAAKSLLAEGKGAPDRIVAKAVAAAGAEDPLSTPKGFFLRTEGCAYFADVEYRVTRDVYLSFSGRKRCEFTVVMEGRKEKSIMVIDKNHGWLRDRGKLDEAFRTDDLSTARLTQETERLDHRVRERRQGL